jgi:tetratricopeptide (TPR) repeat protein
MARILIKLGDIDQDLQFDERACKYYFASINYMQNNDQFFADNQTLARVYYKLAFSAYYIGQIYAAVEYYDRAINILIKGSDYWDPNVIHKHNELKSNCYSIDQDMIDIYSDLVATHLNLVRRNDVTEDFLKKTSKQL